MREDATTEPAIKLFGKKITLNTDGQPPLISADDLPSLERVEVVEEDDEKAEKVPLSTMRDFCIGECFIRGSEDATFFRILKEFMG